MGFDGVLDKVLNKLAGNKLETIEQPEDQPKDELHSISFVKDKLQEIRSGASRITQEGMWLTNAAYLKGFDSIFFDTRLKQFRPINYPGKSLQNNKMHVNVILPRVQNRLARLTKNPPRYDVRPNTMDQDDKDATRLGLQIINNVWDVQRINAKRLDLCMWMQQCGSAFIKTCWDASLGPKVMLMGQNGPERRAAGDIRIDIVSPFEIFQDPQALTLKECAYIIQAKIRPLAYFRTQYPDRGHLVREEDVWLTSLQYQQRINSFNNTTGAQTGSSNLVKNCAIELNYYESPNYRHPDGRHLIVAGDILLKDGPLPIDEMPFSKFDDVSVAGSFWAESVITHMRSLQDQYNRVIAQRAAWTNAMLHGKYLAARGHALMSSALTDQSGEIVEYDPVPNAAPPTAMQTPSIPQYAYQEDDYILSKMDDIVGINEASRGQMPSASIPAIGMQFLVEQDDTRIGTVTEQNEYAYADTGRQILKFVSNYYNEERVLKIAGKPMEYVVKNFRGEDLRNNHDVVVIRGSTLPGSKVLRRQEIINLHQSGYLGDPNDPKVKENVLSMLEYGEIGEAWKDHSLDMAQIKKAIDKIEQGQKPAVSEYDNHPLIIQELNRYRKSEKYDQLDDMGKQALIETMNDHLEQVTNMVAPETTGADSDPAMQPSTDAQMQAEQLLQEEMPQDTVEDEQLLVEPGAQ